MTKYMKRIFYILIAALLALTACSTADTSDIETRLDNIENGLGSAEGRLDEIEKALLGINSDIAALQYLKSGVVINNVSGSDTEGWKITFADGKVVTVWPKDDSTAIPLLSISEDGYWMVDMGDGNGPQYIHDAAGARVSATSAAGEPGAPGKDGVTPVLGVDADGYWTVSYDNGQTFAFLLDADGQKIKAQVSVGDTIFKSVNKEAGTVVFTLLDNTVYTVPVVPDFLCAFKDIEGEQEFTPGQTRTFELEMKGVADAIVVCPQGWSAVLDGTSLSVTSPSGTKADLSYRTNGFVSVLATCTTGFASIAKMAVKCSGETPGPGPDPGDEDTSYYDIWTAGRAIEIGGKSFAPADYSGIKVYHITEDGKVPESINTTGGIYFVDEGVTLTLDMNMYPNATGSAAKAFIVLCDKVGGGRAKFRVNGKTLGFKGNFSVAFKNMEITSTSTNGFIQSSNDGDASMNNNLIFDGCKIDMSAHTSGSFYFANFNGGYGFRDVILSGSDIVYPAVESRQFFIYGKTNGNVLGDLTIKNNLCYIKGGSATDEIVNQTDDRALIHDLWTGTLKFTNITMENNSFVNCFGKARVVSGNAQLVAQGGSLVVKNNLYYLNGEPQAYLKLVDLSDGNKTGVNITASENYSYVTAHPEKVQPWGNVALTLLDNPPFTTMNFADGVFTQTLTVSELGIGANR